MSNPSDIKEPPASLILAYTALAYQTKTEDILNTLCKLYVRSKSTQVIRHNKSITAMTNKLEKIHTKLCGPYNPQSQSRSTEVAILIFEYTQTTWTLYL